MGALDRALGWARHPRAPWLLGAVSFSESSFFPIPPDVMLVPMALARPHRALRLAAWTTLSSVAGGVAGYLLGWLALESVRPLLLDLGYGGAFGQAQRWFAVHGFAAVLIAGFSPIPYKVFCWAAGSMGMALGPFVLASIVGRGARFFLIGGLMAWGGERAEAALRRHGRLAGWAFLAGAVALYVAARGM